jgi:pyruvate/2-oxoglutarate dehydrogenase complex dihydrolipoamide dehydrogenase (E3) component
MLLPRTTPCPPATTVRRIEQQAAGHYLVTYRAGADGPEQQLEVGLVMMATGRRPRTQHLGLEVSSGHHQLDCLGNVEAV